MNDQQGPPIDVSTWLDNPTSGGGRASAPALDKDLRAWLVGQILPSIVDRGIGIQDEVCTAIAYADEAIYQLHCGRRTFP